MTENILQRYFEHNLWANLQILKACENLSDEQLDAEPQTATKGTIRQTLAHIAEAEDGYLCDLTGEKRRFDNQVAHPLAEIQESFTKTGEGLLHLAKNPADERLSAIIHTWDGYTIRPWVLMLQAVNHASEHREQIKSMLTALGVKPPRIDGWVYAREQNAFIAPAK